MDSNDNDVVDAPQAVSEALEDAKSVEEKDPWKKLYPSARQKFKTSLKREEISVNKFIARIRERGRKARAEIVATIPEEDREVVFRNVTGS